MMMAVLLSSQSANAQTRIAVISDTHVMDISNTALVTPGSESWDKAVAADRKLLDYSKAIFDKLVEKYKAEQPDLLLVTGDLTKDGEGDNLRYVFDRLRELTTLGIKVYVIPGNHDIGGNSNTLVFNGANTSPASTWDVEKFKNNYYEQLCGGTLAYASESSLTYAVEPVDGLLLIGIDSHSGAVSEADLDWVCEQAEQAAREGKQVLAMMHHPLFPHIYGADIYVNTATVNDYTTVRNRLADAGVRVVLSGHFHTSDIAKDWNADKSKEIYDINTGSTVSYPCDYRMLELNEDMTQLTVSTESVTELDGVENFRSVAKARLAASMKKIAEDKINGKFGAMAAAFKTQVEELSAMAANAFTIHAEGDENESTEAQALFNELKNNGLVAVAIALYPDLENSMESVLTDTSNYGDKDREDQTPDRQLTIGMPVLTESITLDGDGWATYCTDRRLDLGKTAGLTGYMVTGIGTTAVTISEVNVVAEKAGILLSGDGGSAYALHATGAAADDMSGNLLLGTLTETDAPENAYVLARKDGLTAFYPAAPTLKIPAHKAYLKIGGGAAARFIGQEPTGISTIHPAGSQRSSFYTLQGVRTAKPGKGVYVKDGRLVIVK